MLRGRCEGEDRGVVGQEIVGGGSRVGGWVPGGLGRRSKVRRDSGGRRSCREGLIEVDGGRVLVLMAVMVGLRTSMIIWTTIRRKRLDRRESGRKGAHGGRRR